MQQSPPDPTKEDLQLTGEWDLKFLQLAQDFGDISNSPLLTLEATPLSSRKSSSQINSCLKKQAVKNRTSEELHKLGFQSPVPTTTTPSTPFRKKVLFENTECSTPLSNAMLEEKFSAVEKERLIAYRTKLESSEKELKKVKSNLADEQKASLHYRSTIESLKARVQELENKHSSTPCGKIQRKSGIQLRVESPNRLQFGLEPDNQARYATELVQNWSLKEQQSKDCMEYSHELDLQVKNLREENERLKEHLQNASKQMQEQIDELAALCEQASSENESLIEESTALKAKLEEKEKNEQELCNQLNILKEKVETFSAQQNAQYSQQAQLEQDNNYWKKELETTKGRLEQTLSEMEALRIEKQNWENSESDWKQKYEKLERENTELQNQMQDIQQTWKNMQTEYEQSKKQQEEYIEKLAKEKKSIQEELTDVKEKYQNLKQTQLSLEEQNAVMKQEMDVIQLRECELKEKWEITVEEDQLLKKSLTETQNEYNRLQDAYKKLCSDVEQKESSYEATTKNLEERVSALGNELEAMTQKLHSQSEDIQLKDNQLDLLKQEMQQISNEKKEIQTQLEKQESEKVLLEKSLAEKQDEIDKYRSQYEKLEEEFYKKVSLEPEKDEKRLEDRIEELSLQVADLTDQLKRLDEENSRLISGDSQTKHKIQFVAKLKDENRQLRNQYLELQSRMRELQRKLAPTPAKPKYHLPKASKCSEEETGSGTRKKDQSVGGPKKESSQEKHSQKDHPYLTRSRFPNLDKENEQSNV